MTCVVESVLCSCADMKPAKREEYTAGCWHKTLFPHNDSQPSAPNYRIDSQTPENASHFAMRIALFSPLTWHNDNSRSGSNQGQPRSLILVPIECVCDFQLVINSNHGPILHRFGDTVANRSKIASLYPTLIIRHRSWWPLWNFFMNRIFPQKTRTFGLFDGEEIMTPALFVLTQYRSVTDGQTDIGALAIGAYSACMACYATALVKIRSRNRIR